ncbi:MAG: diguanylate cyclase (GGDEF)-like protein [Arenicella sp.]|jgi:diguanylate cyclase (GGDEF)-like protein
MLSRFLILLFLIFTSSSHGSKNYDDILEQANSLRTSDPNQSDNLLRNIDETQLTKEQKDLYNYLLASYHFTIGKPQIAKELIIQLLGTNPADTTKFRSLSQLITIHMSTHDWPNAIKTTKLLQEQLSLTPELDPTIQEESEFKIFDFYNNIGEYELAKKLGIELMAKVESSKIHCVTQAVLLLNYLETTPEQISPENFYKSRASCQALKDPMLENIVNAYFAKYYLVINKPLEALEVLSNNLEAVKSIQYQALIVSFYELMAKSYLAINDFAQAEKHAQIILDTEKQHQYEPSITSAYEVLAEVFEQSKRFKQALYYYQRYSEAKQLNLDQENAKLLALQKAEFDAADKNVHIALLDKENALLKTQALLDSETAQNKRLALGLLSLVLVMFVLWTYKNRRNYLRMQHYAQTDELTGIANRHHFTQQANTAIQYCKRTNQPVSFIMIDLDYFKRINDTYGHQAGDVALKIAVDAAKSACRKNDIVGRLGGEEFGVLLPGCASHLASFIAENCRKAIEQADFTSSGHDLDVTASFGIADSSNCEYNFEKLFAGADYALYQSKDLGRNRVVQYQQEAVAFDI